MSDKMREEFDVWFDNKHKTDNESLNFVIREAMFDAWKASRAVLCVEFTKPRETDSSGLPCYDEYWREDVEDMLNASGIHYK